MYTLGINHTSHESAACLVRDGEVMFATAEERLSRQKFDSSFPTRAIRAALDHANVDLADLSAIGFGWPRPFVGFRHELWSLARHQIARTRWNVVAPFRYLALQTRWQSEERLLRQNFPSSANLQPLFYSHHLAHALSAGVPSGFDQAAILVVDGRGARHATTIWRYEHGKLDLLQAIYHPNSLGLLYNRFTGYLGFEPLADEWKVMGLAAYGEPGISMRPFIRLRRDGYIVNGRMLLGRQHDDLSYLEYHLGPRRHADEPIEQRHRDVAFAVQEITEQALSLLARRAVTLAGSKNLCIAGGVALNCKANGEIVRQGIVDQLFVPPAASDDGTSLGAALAAEHAISGRVFAVPMHHALLGQEWSDASVETALRTYGLRYASTSDPAGTAAQYLAAGKVVGWFQGRTEFGARALGARSILGDPRTIETRDRINLAVKYREEWRPFAPAVKEEVASRYFEYCQRSPFMTVTYRALPLAREQAPAIVHADGTARVQTVSRADAPLLWRLLDEFERLTGVPILLNTSFNLKGEPIVNTVKDAIETFYTSGMEVLVLGSFVLTKPGLDMIRPVLFRNPTL